RLGGDRTLAVDGLTQRVDDATEASLSDRDVRDALGATDGGPFLDGARVTEDRDAHVVVLEVQHEPVNLLVELDELAGHGAFQAVDARDAVTGGEHRPRFRHQSGSIEVLNLLLDDLGDLVGAELHGRTLLLNARSWESSAGEQGLGQEARARRRSNSSRRP